MAEPVKIDSKEKFTRWRNYQALQQALFLGLINQYCDIVFAKPFKKTKATLQFIQVNTLVFSDDDIIPFATYIQQRCKLRMENDIEHGVLEKTAMRRYENNKFAAVLHFLTDLLLEFGYFFSTTTTNGKNGTPCTDTVKNIFNNGNLVFNKHDIEEKGKLINEYICSKFNENETNYVIHRKDTTIYQLLFNERNIKTTKSMPSY
ncbi:TATA-binding protein-associated phosphoprotein [Entamoeba marina]